MRDAGYGNQDISHQAEEDQPGHAGAAGRRIDRGQQAVRIDRRLGVVERQPGFVVHRPIAPGTSAPPHRAPSPNALVRPTIAEKLWRVNRCRRKRKDFRVMREGRRTGQGERF